MKNKARKSNNRKYSGKRNIPVKDDGIMVAKDSSSRRKCVVSYCTFGILGLLFFFMKKNNNYVKFHGLQAAFMNFPVLVLVTILLRYLPYQIPSLLLFMLLLFDMSSVVKCRKHLFFKYFYFGDLAETIVLKKYR